MVASCELWIKKQGVDCSDVVGTRWNIASAVFKKTTTLTNPFAHVFRIKGIGFNPTGTKFYFVDSYYDKLRQLDLATAYDLDSVTLETAGDLAAQGMSSPSGFFIKPDDGQYCYITDSFSGGSELYQIRLDTPWDVAVLTAWNTPVFANPTVWSIDIDLSPDGTKFISGEVHGGIDGTKAYQYDLPTAWDVHIHTYANKEIFDPVSDGLRTTHRTNRDGLQYITTASSDFVLRSYTMGAWDASTADNDNETFDYSAVMTLGAAVGAIFFKHDNTGFFIAEYDSDKVHEFIMTP